MRVSKWWINFHFCVNYSFKRQSAVNMDICIHPSVTDSYTSTLHVFKNAAHKSQMRMSHSFLSVQSDWKSTPLYMPWPFFTRTSSLVGVIFVSAAEAFGSQQTESGAIWSFCEPQPQAGVRYSLHTPTHIHTQTLSLITNTKFTRTLLAKSSQVPGSWR